VTRQVTPHTTYHPECRDTGFDGGGHVCTHGDASVDIDAEVTDDRHLITT